jgi:hypothetical protein
LSKSLVGKKDITKAVRRSWNTIKGWIENEGFPARKIDGVWESHDDLIETWRKERITTQKAPV